MDIVTEVYRLTADFPKEEKYGLTSQIRRVAVSVVSNVAEGAGRNSDKEFVHFLGISNGSSYELQTQLMLSRKFNLLDERVNLVLDELNQLQKINYTLQQKLSQN